MRVKANKKKELVFNYLNTLRCLLCLYFTDHCLEEFLWFGYQISGTTKQMKQWVEFRIREMAGDVAQVVKQLAPTLPCHIRIVPWNLVTWTHLSHEPGKGTKNGQGWIWLVPTKVPDPAPAVLAILAGEPMYRRSCSVCSWSLYFTVFQINIIKLEVYRLYESKISL